MRQQRWLRIIPAALIMYTIAYIDRTNLSLALDPKISKMTQELGLTDTMKGDAGGFFFIGYMLLQIPGGYLAGKWSARKLISICLVFWGLCAAGCGLAHTYHQFLAMRFLLGVAESAVFPATLVLVANWFPRAERARANNGWMLCQPLGIAGAAPITGKLLGLYGWRPMLILEGLLPFLWLPIWWFFVRDRPSQAKWIDDEEKRFLETTLQQEASERVAGQKPSWLSVLTNPTLFVMVALYFLHNSAVYGVVNFFTKGLPENRFSGAEKGVLMAVPYALTALVMIITSRHSDKTRERRGHVAAVYVMSGTSLLLSMAFSSHFWISYALLCLAVPGPFAAMAPFWAIAGETLAPSVMGIIMGLVNAFGNLGGYAGQHAFGWLLDKYHSTSLSFDVLGIAMLCCAALAFLLPKSKSSGTMGSA